ncbi:MAG TPA: hypothetical protein VHM90_14380 [Phycisphaerae bacterium]|nr:hypothetical protein [Phycisphaerae bacterium]
MRRTRTTTRNFRLIEPLEPRALLSGVTIITHGAEFLSTSRPGWIGTMATAIRNATGPSTAIYQIRVEPNGSGVKITSFSKLTGPSPTSASSTNDETVLLLDWAAASTVDLFGLSAKYSVSTVAAAVVPYLTTAFPSIGLTAPLAEGSIQIMGHSRGGPLATELAKDLGQKGIWVDQVTLFDPVGVPPDPGTSLKSNVIFADDYYQHSGDGFLVPNGSAIAGAFNVGPLKLGGAYGTLDGKTHGDVHLFYFGTINTASKASDGGAKVVDSWYAANHVTKQTTGFYYTRLAGGARPASGIGSAFGGSGARGSITHSGAQWANLALLNPPAKVGEDGIFSASFRYNSYHAAATISWFLDVDTNPYNDNSIPISDPDDVAQTGDAPVSATANFQVNTTAGTYYLEGQISNDTGTRYAYSKSFTVGNLPPEGALDATPTRTTALTGWAADPDAPASAIQIRADSDGTPFYTGPAGIDRPALADTLGSTNHGFSVDLASLLPGWHDISLYALDATSHSPTLIGTKKVYTNAPPAGKFESFDGHTLTGWALDPNAGASSSPIEIRIDNLPPIFASADVARPDLPANQSAHGFSVTLPQLKPGVHSVTVYAIDSTTAALKSLGNKAARVLDVPGNRLPTGKVTFSSAGQITGWAFDPTTAATSIQLRIDIDGAPGTPFDADLPRPDLLRKLGSTAHGFSQALALSPGEHKIDVYVLDSTTHTPVLLASRLLGAARPKGAFDLVTASTASGYAWSAALGASPAFLRIDIDASIGNIFQTTQAHPIPNTTPPITGTFGFTYTLPPAPPGNHTLTLYFIDPFTFAITKLATQSVFL